MASSLRRALVRARGAAQDFHGQLRADFAPLQTLELYTFARAEDVGRFQVTTDRVLGGRTAASFARKEYAGFAVGCFAGAIDYAPDDDGAAARGGFAAFRTKPDERARDVSAFEGVELRVKTDGRAYVANFKCADHSPEQLWQARIVTPAFQWTRVAVPFKDLTLVTRGRVEALQVPLNRATLNGFGVLLADGANGPFRFELQAVHALRAIHASEWESRAETALLEAAAAPGGGRSAARLGASGGAASDAGTALGVSSDAAAPRDALPAPRPNASREEVARWAAKARSEARVK